jgi:hypothetical protein
MPCNLLSILLDVCGISVVSRYGLGNRSGAGKGQGGDEGTKG